MTISRALPTLLAAWCAAACAACAPQVRTVPGPEDPELAAEGSCVWSLPKGGIEVFDVATGETRVLREPWEDKPGAHAHAVSGPDRAGRIAYIADHFFGRAKEKRQHALRITHLEGGQETELFVRDGSAMSAMSAGKGEIGTTLALAPSGGRVAFLSGLRRRQLPGALLHEGAIEIWSIEEARCEARIAGAAESILPSPWVSWFAEGERLAFVRLTPRKSLPRSPDIADHLGGRAAGWDVVPSVWVHDLRTGEEEFVLPGWRPVVSRAGEVVFVESLDVGWSAFDMKTRRARSVTWTGDAAGIVAAPTPETILFLGKPTKGQPAGRTKHFSPLVGPRALRALKLAAVDTTRFRTLLPQVDPRLSMSYGIPSDMADGDAEDGR